MSKLQELIQQYCPDGVEFQTVDKIIADNFIKVITPKKKIQRNDYKNVGSVPIISQEIEYISGYCDENDDNIKKGIYICFGDHSEHIKYIDFAFVQGADGLKIMKMNSNQINPKYFYYAVCQFYNRKNNYERHFKYFRNTEIPVPPLEVQAEIVRILDTFTELQTKLEEELTARQKQYEYYRDSLLSFKTDIAQWIELGEVAKVTKLAGFEFTKYVQYSDSGKIIALRGLNVKNGQLNLDDVKYIDDSDLSKLGRSKLYIGDMLFTYVGTVGQVALIDKNDRYYLAPNVAMIRIENSKIKPKFLLHYFQSNYFRNNQINRLLQSSSMQNIPMEKIRKFFVPIPPLDVQQRIVEVLDNFEKICTDLKIGLPAEINARQKQYEYYRDLLLNFDCSQFVKVEREREREREREENSFHNLNIPT